MTRYDIPPYYLRGNTAPTPRNPQPRPSTPAVVLFILLLGTLISLSLWWSVTHELPTEAQRRVKVLTRKSIGPTYTQDAGQVIWWYVFRDPETGYEYLVNDRGGCTPRLKREVNESDD